MDEDVQNMNKDLTNQSNKDEDNENIGETIQQDERIRGQAISGRIIRTPSRYMYLYTKFSKNTQEYEPKYAQLMDLIM